jgi:hypothetical protein
MDLEERGLAVIVLVSIPHSETESDATVVAERL